MTVKLTRLALDGDALRVEAARAKDAKVARRLLSLAAIRDGCNRTEAARRGGMDRQTLRDWVIHYNEEGIAGLSDRHGGGCDCKLSEMEQEQLALWVRRGPDPEEDGVVRWRLSDLRQLILGRFFVVLDERSISRILKALGFSHISARPRNPRPMPRRIKKLSRSGRRRHPRDRMRQADRALVADAMRADAVRADRPN